MRILLLFMVLLSTPFVVRATPDFEPITTENIDNLQSVSQINFGDYSGDHRSGWFAMDDETSSKFASISIDETIVIWNDLGEVLASYSLNNEALVYSVIDVALHGDFILSLHVAGTGYALARYDIQLGVLESVTLPMQSSHDVPVQLWLDCSSLESPCTQPTIWIEVVSDQEDYVMDLRADSDDFTIEIASSLPYAPASDHDAVVRVGRIPAPYTVTSSQEGVVKLWDITVGIPLYETDNGKNEAAVFGAINEAATHFLWRDSQNETLYLLDFLTGKNERVAHLDGYYAQWYFLNLDATVALAVNIGFEPVVVAWNTVTGERMNLGEHLECSRPQPDMARLSEDGTTLVIGCDTGLQIWRIEDAE